MTKLHIKFVRFGGVNSHTHRRQVKNSDFYTVPPANRGIFAFPLVGAIEHYFVAWKYRDKLLMLRDRKVFNYTGLVWHHFWFRQGSLGVRGAWILDNMENYLRKLHTRLAHEDYMTGKYGIRCANDDLEVFLPDKT